MQATNPLISVVIPTYNSAHFLKECLDSVRTQNYSPMEVTVIDDGSTDNTKEVVAEFPEVKYVFQNNQGDAAARNEGIKLSKGDFIAFLDADDIWLANKLNQQIALHEKDSTLGYCLTLQICFLDASISSRPNWLRENLLHNEQVGYLPTILVRRYVFDKVGLFNQSLRTGSDVDWFARCQDANINNDVVHALLSKRRIHTSNLSNHAIEAEHALLLRTLKESVKRKRLKNVEIND